MELRANHLRFVADMEDARSRLEEALSESLTRIAELESQAQNNNNNNNNNNTTTKNNSNKTHQHFHDSQSSQMSHATDQVIELEASLAESQSRVLELERELSDATLARSEAVDLRAELSVSRRENSDLRLALSRTGKVPIGDLNSEHSAREEREAELRREVAFLRGELAKVCEAGRGDSRGGNAGDEERDALAMALESERANSKELARALEELSRNMQGTCMTCGVRGVGDIRAMWMMLH